MIEKIKMPDIVTCADIENHTVVFVFKGYFMEMN